MLDPKVELKIQQGIRKAEDKLVTLVTAALNKESTYGKLKPSQFRNLVRVAGTTESAEVIKNFLRYQVGRDAKEKKWGTGPGSLAENLIRDIGDASGTGDTLSAIAKQIAKQSAVSDVSVDFKPIWLSLIRRYLGYGARHLIAIRPESE